MTSGVLTIALAICACSGSKPAPEVSAPPPPPPPYAPAAPDGTLCKTFNGSMFSVCTPACDTANPCPMQGADAVTCNGMGLCKPNAPNADCTSP